MKNFNERTHKQELVEQLEAGGWPLPMLAAMTEGELERLSEDAPEAPGERSEPEPPAERIRRGLGLSLEEYERAREVDYHKWQEAHNEGS